MLIQRKIWFGLSLVSVTAIAQAQQAPGAAATPVTVPPASSANTSGSQNYPGGTFSDALKKVLAGEGGEGGIGMSKLHKGVVTIPALNDAQITEALRGNTLRSGDGFALHFQTGGTFSGWEVKWNSVPMAKCTKDAGEDYDADDGECWHANHIAIPQGKWNVRDGKLCTEPALARVADGESCVAMALVLNNIAVFNAKGDMIGKGIELLPGKKLEKVLKK